MRSISQLGLKLLVGGSAAAELATYFLNVVSRQSSVANNAQNKSQWTTGHAQRTPGWCLVINNFEFRYSLSVPSVFSVVKSLVASRSVVPINVILSKHFAAPSPKTPAPKHLGPFEKNLAPSSKSRRFRKSNLAPSRDPPAFTRITSGFRQTRVTLRC
jgi:hypothetical protein